MAETVPYATSTRHEVCAVCPSLDLPGGEFDVLARPSKDCPFDPATGRRFTTTRVPVCVHPHKVGLPAAPYATQSLPLPWQTDPPEDPEELVSWLKDAITSAPPHTVSKVIERASAQLRRLRPGVDVTATLRAALSS